MATASTETAAPQAATTPDEPAWNEVTLTGVDWDVYDQLRRSEGNDHVRMSYLDGTLTIMSPEIFHDGGSVDLEILIRSACAGLGVKLRSIRTTTLRRKLADHAGGGKEPDASFYLGANERRMRRATTLDLAVDPPPDLAVEVDNTRDSTRALPIFARPGIPEVWRYEIRAKTLWFGRLEGDTYVSIDRSVALPGLTPALVLEAIAVCDQGEMDEVAWSESVKEWARGLPAA